MTLRMRNSGVPSENPEAHDARTDASAALMMAAASVLLTLALAVVGSFAIPAWVIPLPGTVLAVYALIGARRCLRELPRARSTARKRARLAQAVALLFLGYLAFEAAALARLGVAGKL